MQQQDNERRIKQYFRTMQLKGPQPRELLPIFIFGSVIIVVAAFINPILSGITAIGFSLFLYYVIDQNFTRIHQEIIEILKQLPTER